MSSFRVLGIETSCDDTAVGIVRSDGKILGECARSQWEPVHAHWGGIVPHLAARSHESCIEEVTRRAVVAANGAGDFDFDAVAVTVGPGLAPCLRVGASFAEKLAEQHSVPLIQVNHLEAHLLTPRMFIKDNCEFPFLVLLVSGGHTMLVLARGVGDYILIGDTMDQSVGETFDKVARSLGVVTEGTDHAHPGAALEARAARGNPRRFDLPRPLSKSKNHAGCAFSFSGLLSAVNRKIDALENISDSDIDDMAASFQCASAMHLSQRLRRAIVWCDAAGGRARGDNEKEKKEKQKHLEGAEQDLLGSLCVPKSIVVSGGAARNGEIRRMISAVGAEAGIPVSYPPMEYCTDNGIMIAWAGVEQANAMCGRDAVSAPVESLRHLKSREAGDAASKVKPRWPPFDLTPHPLP